LWEGVELESTLPIRGLQKQDFTLLDDKRPQSILSFHAVDGAAVSTVDPPEIEIVLVIDAVNSYPHVVSYKRKEVKRFLLRNGGKLAQPVSLVVLADNGTKIRDGSTGDGNALASLYDQYETGLRSFTRSQGFYGAAERFDLSKRPCLYFTRTRKSGLARNWSFGSQARPPSPQEAAIFVCRTESRPRQEA
jgi:hypothetical protein